MTSSCPGRPEGMTVECAHSPSPPAERPTYPLDSIARTERPALRTCPSRRPTTQSATRPPEMQIRPGSPRPDSAYLSLIHLAPASVQGSRVRRWELAARQPEQVGPPAYRVPGWTARAGVRPHIIVEPARRHFVVLHVAVQVRVDRLVLVPELAHGVAAPGASVAGLVVNPHVLACGIELACQACAPDAFLQPHVPVGNLRDVRRRVPPADVEVVGGPDVIV